MEIVWPAIIIILHLRRNKAMGIQVIRNVLYPLLAFLNILVLDSSSQIATDKYLHSFCGTFYRSNNVLTVIYLLEVATRFWLQCIAH